MEGTQQQQQQQQTVASRVSFGVLLAVAGVILLLDKMLLIEIGPWWRLWPLVLVALGLSNLLQPRESRSLGWGVGLILLAICYLLINFEVFGISWRTGWPLILVAVGVGLVFGALQRNRTEARNE